MKVVRILLGLAGLVAVYSAFVEPCRLRVAEEEVTAPPDRRLEHPVRALLLTDWHLGRFSLPGLLRVKLRRLLRRHRTRPFDLVLLGGDFLDVDPRCLRQLPPLLAVLAEFGVPVFAVLGNHDYTSFGGDPSPLVACLKAHGVRLLRNEAAAVTVSGRRLLVIGLDDLQEASSYYNPDTYKTPGEYREAAKAIGWYARFDGVEPGTPRILLTHNPDGVYLPGRTPLAVLAGHTHGGQVMLLDWVSRVLHSRLHMHLPPGSAVTWAGRRTVNGRTLIVSRGMEGSALPLRLLRPPEAVAVTFR